ncbi:MAG: DUF309 domain-containing protein [Acidimicrobiia bacterium]|nr:DUF309 domain-containing protein [Acidimicrobiia bacterium]
MQAGFARGIELFNAGEFYECHEVLEAVWMQATGAHRWFLQSLIHLAVAYYQHGRGNAIGERLQFEKGLKKLAGYLPAFEGIDTKALYEDVIDWRESGGPPPVIASLA